MKTIKVEAIIRKLYVNVDGKDIEVKQIDDASHYPKNVTVYSKELVKGTKAGTTTYCVAVEDYIAKKRVSTKESITSMLASGMSNDEIVAKLAGL